MKQFLLYSLVLSIFLTSCATLLNTRHKDINIYTTEPSQIILNEDTITTENNKATFIVKRQNEPLKLKTINPNYTNEVEVNPFHSFYFWSNIVFNYGLGMLFEAKKPKSYTYPTHILVDGPNSENIHYNFIPRKPKGSVEFHVSLPLVTSYNVLVNDTKREHVTGLMGYSLGLDVYHAENNYLQFGYAHTFSVPFQNTKAMEYNVENFYSHSKYIHLSNNHLFKNFSIGYGLSLTEYHSIYKRLTNNFIFNTYEKRVTKHKTIGLLFPAYVHLGDHFRVGLIYKPSFYRPSMSDKWAYEHMISLDMALKFRLIKK